uniref:Biotin-protein ligase N-terminal domain-containing protein n=1 Tax=Biomphalaria glabrata TaxID=6526 RepID=A0A2C9L0H1_BIOGL
MISSGQHKHILIYNGKGSDEESRNMLYHSIDSVADKEKHVVSYITAQEIKEGVWDKTCQLIVFGGGYDRGFNEAVGQDGMSKIRDFVLAGGHYLGLCAGAYWACDHIEFDKTGPLEVVGERFLKFFPGLCIGPAFPGFQYNSTIGARAVPVYYDKVGAFDTYMNGGGYFLPYLKQFKSNNVGQEFSTSLNPNLVMHSRQSLSSHSTPRMGSLHGPQHKNHSTVLHNSWKALGVYSSLENKPAAVVSCQMGKGTAILSGVHLEYPVKLLHKDDPHILQWLPVLSLSEEKRLFVFSDLLRQLGVIVRQCKAVL